MIVCGSQHVADTLRDEGGPIEKTRVVPYAVDVERFASCAKDRVRDDGRPLRVLCVANVLLGKGVQYLIETARMLRGENVRIRLVGPIHVSGSAVVKLREAIDVAGAVPRSETLREYTNADVFVLPTLSEGSATVCYEAIAAGLPVITTPAAGSVVRDGVEGRIVPIRDPQALADAIAALRATVRCLARCRIAHRNVAAEFTFDHYGQRLMDVVNRAASIVRVQSN